MAEDLTFPFNVKRGWQPIESAPKDGRSILLFDRIEREAFIASYRVHGGHEGPYGLFVWQLPNDGGVAAEGIPSHWMPLPAPPEGGK